MRTDKDLDDNRLSTEDIAGADRHQDTPDADRYQDMPDETGEHRDLGTTDRYDTMDDEPRAMTDERDLPDAESHAGTTRLDDEPRMDEPRMDGRMDDEPAGTTPSATAHMGPSNGDDAPLELFGADEIDRFRDEWRDLQGRFVDDPQEAVQGADHLVAEVMKSLATTFTEHKHELEGQWRQEGSEAHTEELRQALRRYRTFFNQLLNA